MSFPFEQLNPVAQLESWRKEINRPIYHVHKWWANRLGSVFRAIILAARTRSGQDVWEEFYRKHNFSDCIVLDPFMGSGTTIGEALKLGCQAVGADINPVAVFQVRKALEFCDEEALWRAFRRLERTVAPKIRQLYRSHYRGLEADILYTFWVKLLECPLCRGKTRLFRKWIFSSHAYPGRKPKSRALCPHCGELSVVHYAAISTNCASCQTVFNPQTGPVEGQSFACEACGERHRIIDVVRHSSSPPEHEMYAMLLLLPDGGKVYKRPDDADLELYRQAVALLEHLRPPVPVAEIPEGYNTNQARSYNYRFWRQMFNERQLLSLGMLLQEILIEPDANVRECLLLLFSGTLEFNNMFCSFKGEGTGAVRHLFHHHILKPERTPLEAHPWGTDKSSGSFSTLFERRLLSAKRYCADPFELRVVHHNGKIAGKKVHGINQQLRPRLASSFEDLASDQADVLLLSADSSSLPIPAQSVDLVVTDPPYFDNVHYSELADFFYCWLQLGLQPDYPAFRRGSSRSEREVQGRDAAEFGEMLRGVLAECHRVLKPEGALAFTFHHSRDAAWIAVASAIAGAGFEVVAAHPVKAEMSVGVPKNQAREPIDLDLVIVGRKRPRGAEASADELRAEPDQEAELTVRRYNQTGTRLSRGDIRVILMGAFLKAHSSRLSAEPAVLIGQFTSQIERLYEGQDVSSGTGEAREEQLSFSFGAT